MNFSLAISRQLLLRFTAEAITKVAGFTTMPLLIHFINTDGYGRYSFAQAAVSAAIPLVSLGLGFSLVRQIAGVRDAAVVAGRLASAFLMVSAAAVPVALLVWCIAPFLPAWPITPPGGTGIARASAVLLVMSAWQGLAMEALRAREQVGLATGLQITEAVLFPLAIFGMARADAIDPTLVITALSVLKAGSFLVIASLCLMRRGLVGVPANRLNTGELRAALGLGLPFMVAGLGEWLMALGDRLAVGSTLGADTLGSYAAAQVLVAVLASWGAPFWWLLFPRFCSALETGGRDHAAAVSRQFGSLFFELGIPVAMAIVMLGNSALQILSSGHVAIDRITILLLTAATFINQAATPWEYALYAERRGATLMKATLLWGSVAFCLIWLCMPTFGLDGVAAAVLAGRIGFAVTVILQARAMGYRDFLLTTGSRLLAVAPAVLAGGIAAIITLTTGNEASPLPDFRSEILAATAFTAIYGAALFLHRHYSRPGVSAG